MDRKDNSPIVVALLCLLVATSLCASDKSLPDATTAAPVQPDSAEAKWSALVQRRPFPYSAPLPPEEPTLLDGTYTKTDPKTEPRVSCRRCPDYAPEGGLWKIQFDRSVFRIFHAPSGWKASDPAGWKAIVCRFIMIRSALKSPASTLGRVKAVNCSCR